jgi:hypothetical protein
MNNRYPNYKNMKRETILLSIIILLFGSSCKSYKIVESPKINSYLHLSHTRTNINPDVDSLVEMIDFDRFDMLWLGGDLAKATSANNKAMTHVDSIFNVGKKSTLWALGNHDYQDLNRVEEFTHRSRYYSTNKNKITIVVLDTQDSLSSIVGDQKDLLFKVLDTLNESTHLILLHHKLIWMYNNNDLETQNYFFPNGRIGGCGYCINPNNFNSEIYPKLVEIKQKGIEVLCIGGDIGVNRRYIFHGFRN